MEDEEYDSDMDSFIDDSELDELSRKDFEETLRFLFADCFHPDCFAKTPSVFLVS